MSPRPRAFLPAFLTLVLTCTAIRGDSDNLRRELERAFAGWRTAIASPRPGSASSGVGSRSLRPLLKRAIPYKMPEKPAGVQPPRERRRPESEPVALDIVHEDDALLVLNKPPGIVVHPTYKNQTGTLLNGVLWKVRHRPGIQPSIITRLDKDTSGLMVVARTPQAHAALVRALGGGWHQG